MILWLALSAVLAAALAGIGWPLLFRVRPAHGADDAVYRAQLGEIDREEQLGLTRPDDARLARIEIQRRLLAVGVGPISEKEPASMATTLTDRSALIAVAGLLVIGSVGIYAVVGQPRIAAASRGQGGAETLPQNGAKAGDASLAPVDEMITRLEARLKNEPNDGEGWRMLGWSKFRTNDFGGAAEAYAHAVKLKPKDAETLSAWGEAIARAADGRVTPEAEAALRDAMKVDPANPRARFLLGLKKEQDGQPAAALDDWLTMLKSAPADADWFDDVRGRAVELSEASHIDISRRLPPLRNAPQDASTPSASLEPAARPGPTEQEVQSAGAMSAKDRQAMIEDMVARLDQKLRQSPADADGWVKLIHARRVLGEDGEAQAALRRANLAFVKDASARKRFAQAATEPLGLNAN